MTAPIELICFDIDGTLVHHPDDLTIWEALNLRYGGTRERNRERYDMYTSGRITYEEWVRLDVEDWMAAGATRDEVLEVSSQFHLIEGARETVSALEERGFELAVISGTLDIMLEALFPDHPFEAVYTNAIHFDGEGRLSGWRATRFDHAGKPEALREIAARHDIALSGTAFVGDGENDVPLLGVCGYFVAFRPRSQRLAKGADTVIKDGALTRLLDIFGERGQTPRKVQA